MAIVSLYANINQNLFQQHKSRDFQTSPSISFLDVNAFLQDSLGYMWIATLGGLNRYNGYEFQHYLHDASDSTSLQNDFVFSLFIDSSQNFWVGTANGTSSFDLKTNRFNRYSGEIAPVYSFFEDRSGQIWVATPLGPGKIDLTKQNVTFPEKPQFVNIFWEDDSHQLWMGLSEEQGLAVKKADLIWEYYTLPGKRGVKSMYSDPQGIWWLGTTAGIVLFDPHSRTFKNPVIPFSENQKLNKTQINFIKEVEPLKLLIGTSTEGFFYYDILRQTLQHNEPARFNPLLSAQLHTCYIDKQDNIWIGSYDKGFVIGSKQSDYFNSDHVLSNKLKDRFVTRIIEDIDKNIWIGTRYDGLYRYNMSGDFKVFENLHLYPNKNEFLETLFIDSKKQLWIGFETQLIVGVGTIDGEIHVTHRFNIEDVRAIKEDENGNIWIGAWTGLYKISSVNDKMKMERIYFSNISDICILDSGILLFSVFGEGVFKIEKESATPQLLNFPSEFNNITGTCVTLFEDTQHRVWIGSYGNGLLCWKDNTYKSLSKKDGLPSNNVLCFQEDFDGNIWLSTSYGISKLKLSTNGPKITSYFKTNGILGDQYHEKAGCISSDGRIFFGGNHGITFFNPSVITPNSTPPLINIEDLKIFNQSVKPAPKSSVLSKNIAFTDEIILNHNQTTISMDYAGIDFFTSNKLTYKYKLEGFDKQWNYVGDFRRATYSNLSRGKYTFLVSAINGDGIESVHPAKLQIIVKSAPWFSWQAWFFYALVFITLIVFLLRLWFHLKINRQLIEIEHNEREREREVSKMKINFFTNISHELRSPLTLISAPLEKLFSLKELAQDDLKSLNIIYRNVQRMLKLMNQLMDFAKIENSALLLKVQYIDIIQEIQNIYESFTYIAERKKINFIFNPHFQNQLLWVDIDKTEKILYNLLSNAIKYTPEKGTIEIFTRILNYEESNIKYNKGVLSKCDFFLEIVVSDTGPGIPKDKLSELFVRYRQINSSSGLMPDYSGSGIGLHYTKTLVETHKGQIFAQTKPECGMDFSFILPLCDIYLDDEKELKKDSPLKLFQSEIIPRKVETNLMETNAYSILIVEDNIELIDFIVDLFSKEYKIIESLDGNEAWDLIQQEPPDLILSDVIIPGISGYDLCSRVKNDIEYCHIPIVLLTAKTSISNQIEGLECGADAYICKPFNVDYLQLTIKNLLRSKEILRQYFATPKVGKNTPTPIISNSQDQIFIDKLINLLENELSNPDLNIDYFAKELGFSRTAFYRKIRGLTNIAPNDFLRNYRLKCAAEIIVENSISLIEVSEQTGFSSYSYFSKSFKKHFGVTPKEYQKRER